MNVLLLFSMRLPIKPQKINGMKVIENDNKLSYSSHQNVKFTFDNKWHVHISFTNGTPIHYKKVEIVTFEIFNNIRDIILEFIFRYAQSTFLLSKRYGQG